MNCQGSYNQRYLHWKAKIIIDLESYLWFLRKYYVSALEKQDDKYKIIEGTPRRLYAPK